ncbi:MAG TPA: 50S ribosomal protein L34e [Candidatus Nanopusillus sp.]|nr:50S ribosomal protein L34e [Candidatus Nanopusillus sp.]
MGKRIIIRRTPGGRISMLIKKAKGNPPKCAVCKKPLRGVVRDHPRKLRKYNKTQKRVSRIFGGYLCHSCLEKLLKETIRKEILKTFSSTT